MKLYQLIYLILFSVLSFGQNQNQQQIDSLKINSLEKKAESFLATNKDSSFFYYNKIVNYSNSKKYKRGSYIGYDLIANLYYKSNEYEAALTNAEKSYTFAKQLKNKKLQGQSENLLAFINFRLNDYVNVSLFAEKALQNGLQINDIDIISNAYLVLGNIHYMKFENNKALNYYHKIDSVTFEGKTYNLALIKSLTNAGNLILRSYSVKDTSYISVGESYFKRARDVAKSINNLLEENYAVSQLGKIHVQRGNYRKAISCFLSSLKYFEKNRNTREMSNSYWILGIAYNQLKKLDSATYYYKKRISLYKNSTDKINLGKAYVEYAGFQYYNKDYKNAIPNYLFGLNLLDSLNYKGLGTMMAKDFELSQSFGELKDYKNAFKYLNKAFILQDSLNSSKQDNLTLELEKKYQTQKKEHEIALLKSQKANQRNVLIGVISLISLIGLFFFFLYKNRQKTNKKLKELDKAKSNFFANISHEFRTPLTLISMPIQEALHDNSLTEKKRSQFEMAQRNSERLLSLVDQVLELSKIDSGDLKLQIQEGNILQLISGLSDSFSFLAKQNNITFKKNIDKQTQTSWFDKDAIEKIVVNLLSNAIKYTPKKGSVLCNASVINGKLILEVKNTGKGLNKEELNAVFKRFYQANAQNQGSGIGLSLIKELVELHKGTINVTSEPNRWTTFKVVLPINKKDFSSKQIIKTPSDKGKVDIPIISSLNNEVEEEFLDNEKPILLVVEDNDDLRILIQQQFETSYNVLAAPNGVIGVDLALEHIPDLIISDIMMPVKDGIELTKTLKNNECTAHIPIILLTAKVDAESQFKGIDIGADDYIMKPFDNKILALKVKKLIEARRKLQLRYSQELILIPKDIAVTDLDEKFLNKVQEILDEKLVESSFNIEAFSKALGMSRMQLHRKIKGLTGLSSSEFIRSQRLKLAAQLLKTSDINISQVGYSVGFNDHSYFDKCFKEMFQCTPTQYSKRKHSK